MRDDGPDRPNHDAGGIDDGLRLEAQHPPVTRRDLLFRNVALAGVGSSALAACGGGGGSSPPPTGVAPPPAPQPPAPPPPPAPTITSAQASRFLGQASISATSAEIASVRSQGYDGWITQQFATARTTTHFDWLMANGYADPANINTQRGFDATIWRQLIVSPDQLRQRVAMALLDFLVVGIEGLPGNWRAFNMAAYVDLLADNAFGNYRQILQAVSLSSAMGFWLTFLGNRKANPATGVVPDENYAREILQLFSIGLVRLNMDGTPQAGDSYTQEDISGLARVFTGFVYPSNDTSTPARYRLPLVPDENRHETGPKTFLGQTIGAGQGAMASLGQALDIIFAHPNVPPFISKQLIQRMVTSNPTPAYVGRVAAVFANNGSGVRGDMKAVIRAILTDSEARSESGLTDSRFGKLRAPVNRFTGWARAFGAASASEQWGIGDTSSSANRLAQGTGHAPSVFNFFRPGYTPPNTAIATQNLVGPEFQITNELSTIAYINFMTSAIQGNSVGDVRANYATISGLAGDANALVNEVALLLAANQLSATTLATIRSAVESIATTATNATVNRVYTAILLSLASPEFITQK